MCAQPVPQYTRRESARYVRTDRGNGYGETVPSA
jgi:hypothetical protein